MKNRSVIKSALIIMCYIFVGAAAGHGVGAFLSEWGPEANEKILILDQRLKSARTAQLELIRENTRLLDNCRWAMLREPLLSSESRATLDAINEAIRQWKRKKE